VMVFEKKGEGTIFTRNVEGQKPQPYLNDVERELEPYFIMKKRQLAFELNRLVR
jgi:hypothetical protein